MEREKEQWINKALNSLDGIKPAVAPVTMHGNIMQRIQAERFRIKADTVQAAAIYRIAAGILLIITINVFACVAVSKSTTKEKQLQSFVKQYSTSDTGDSLLNI